MDRQNWIGAPAFFLLNQACRVITEAYGCNLYLVGSALERRDFRDVDLRLILADEDFARMFPGLGNGWRYDARWSLFCSSVSLYLSQASGLPVDFQVQRRSWAKEHESIDKKREHMGWFIEPAKVEESMGEMA